MVAAVPAVADDSDATDAPINIDVIASGNYYGKNASDLTDDARATIKDDKLVITGSLNYVYDYVGYWFGTEYKPTNEELEAQKSNIHGWYLPLKFTYDAEKYTVSFTSSSNSKEISDGFLIWNLTDSSVSRTIVVKDTESNAEKVYTLDTSGMRYNTYTEFVTEVDNPKPTDIDGVVSGECRVGGFNITDANPNTIAMVFNGAANDGKFYGIDKTTPLYTESLNLSTPGAHVWYFSAGNQLADNDVNLYAGQYTMETLKDNAIASTGSVNVPEPVGMDTQYVGGTAVNDATYGADQIIEVIAGQDWTIQTGVTVKINGQFIVPEGSTITVQEGAELVINGKAVSEIDGDVLIEAGMTDEVENGKLTIGSSVNFNADVTIDGDLVVSKSGYTRFNANATVAETGRIAANGTPATIEVSEVSVLTVYGVIGNTSKVSISNYGSIIIDSDVASGGANIVLLKSGAVVDVINYTEKANDTVTANLTITDAGLKSGSTGSEDCNSITVGMKTNDATTSDLMTVSGLKFTENAVVKTEEGVKVLHKSIDISGEISVSVEDVVNGTETSQITGMTANVSLTGNADGFTVTDGLVIGTGITIDNDGKLTVSGTVTAVAIAVTAGTNVVGTDASSIDNTDGTIVLSGLGSVKVLTALTAGTVEATQYETTEGSDRYQNYVTIDNALDIINDDSTITKIDVLKNQTVTESNTVPAGVTMNVTEDLKIGDDDHEGVVLTISESVKKVNITSGKKIHVNGTLYAENKSKVSSTDDIVSDVKSEELNEKGSPARDGWAKYTNLYTAMTEANAGDTIEVSTTAAAGLVIGKNLVVKDGVTLYIPENIAKVTVNDGITVTVNGFIVTEKDMTAQSKYATTASTVDGQESSALVLGPNGYIAYTGDIDYSSTTAPNTLANTNLAGAYYSMDIDSVSYNVISTLETAIADVASIDGDIVLNGKVAAGDIVFEASDNCDTIVLGTGAEVAFQSLILTGSGLDISTNDCCFTGTVTVGDIALSLVDIEDVTISDVDGSMVVTGTYAEACTDNDETDASVTLVTGTMKASNSSNVKFVVGTGATLEAVSTEYTFADLVINGTVNVPADTLLKAAVATINENGVLNIAPLTSTSNLGTFTVTTFNVGIVGEDYFGIPAGNSSEYDVAAAASVSGPVTLGTNGVAYVAAGVSVADGTFPTGTKSTALYIGDELWMTIYTNRTITFASLQDNADEIPVENAMFQYWTDADGKNLGTANKNIGDVESAFANVKYDVYDVTILSAEGVIDITIDGNLYNPYDDIVFLTAGTHKVEYTLDNGWTGTATLAVNGAVPEGMDCTIDGTNFTISGDFDGTLVLQLTGIEKSGFVPDAPDSKDDSGMGITDYLLIILVVLIVVMAIIVAMRLMRS